MGGGELEEELNFVKNIFLDLTITKRLRIFVFNYFQKIICVIAFHDNTNQVPSTNQGNPDVTTAA